MSLSSSIDKAVKAYIDHTNVVLAGDSSLNVSYLTQPFDQLANTAQLAQQVLHAAPTSVVPQGNGAISTAGADVATTPGTEVKKKRKYKQRDPNAPKRPLTAYFRYLQEQRGPLSAELAAAAGGTPQKPGDLSKEATERWNKLTKDEQQPYRDAYQRALKDYEREVEKYKANGGLLQEGEGKSEPKVATASAVTSPAIVAAAQSEADDESEDEDESSSEESSDDEEEVAPPPPPPPPAQKPHKTKKGKFSSLGNAVASAPAAPSGSTSPERKRKTAATAASDTPAPEDGEGKKKRGRKTATVVAGADVPAEEPPKKKKKKKKVDA